MNQPLLSVIVPVYRARDTLDACVESILAQDFPDMELILVDDGSSDGSGEICDAWARRDERIRVIHQANGGASAARTAGLGVARGRYLSFVDADDRLLPGLYPLALPQMEAEDLDWFGFGVLHTSGRTCPWPLPGPYAGLEELAPELDSLLVREGQIALLYNKIYARRMVGDTVFSNRLAVNEDLLFNLEVLTRGHAFRLCPHSFYLYQDEAGGSLSRRLRTDLLEAEQLTRPAFEAFLAACGLEEEEHRAFAEARRADVCRLQFFLLTGQKGKLPFLRRRALLQECLGFEAGRQAILKQLRQDSHGLLALPYRFCAALRLPGLLALYCGLKEPFLS